MDTQSARRLPPLNALRFFEAAGRLQSIRQAAAELYVTPGAVSRQIQSLESWLGVPLFEHGARSVSLISDEIVLVGEPEYCARHRISGPRDLVRLGSAELLRSLASPRLWQGWLEMAGIPGLVPDCGPTYSDSVLTCRAAAAGQGVALA